MKTSTKVAIGVAAVGAGVTTAFVVQRLSARKKLVSLMKSSATGKVLVDQQLVDWTYEEKAADLLPIFSTKTAEKAFVEFLSEVRTVADAIPATVKPPELAAAEQKETLTYTDQAKAALAQVLPESVMSTAQALSDWWYGTGAKNNPYALPFYG